MTCWLIALTLFLLAGGGFLFVLGRYNALVTVRHRIATVVLEIDFLLQQQAANLEVNPQVAIEGKLLEELQKARSTSHRVASNPHQHGALETLSNALQAIVGASRKLGLMEIRDSQKHQLDHATVRLDGLVAHYHAMLRKNPASWIVRCLLDT